MRELTDSRWITAKGVLFLILGLLAAGLLFATQPSLRVAVLLIVAIWAFCRAYYFAFYVIEHYVDPSYRFSGLISFAKHFILKRREGTKA
jgi:hypothetical protein